MDELLLQTKLYIPVIRPTAPDGRSRTNFIPRPHLIDRLNEGLSGRLTLISAPAGFGKTTLAIDWLEHAKLPTAWLSLDEDDNHFARFWTYFIAAMKTVYPEVGTEVLALLQSSPRPSSQMLLTLLINDLTEIPKGFILVLDDYHAIEKETIDQALDFFIEHLPPCMHLVMISRIDPNLSLARLRANGQLNELRSIDLRFTPAEIAQFFEHMAELSLTESEVAALDRRTEGWIAGLQMAALSLRQQESTAVTQFIQGFTGSHRYIMDYLVDEVLQGLSDELQAFLLYTSILDRLCSPLCDAIVRRSQGSAEFLEYLERANLFIVPLDNHRHWYRYHPLFADLLRQRLQQTYPDQVAKLHLSASQWYEGAGLIFLAVRHALAAQAFSRAAELVEQVAPAMIQRSELTRLLTWLDALPNDVIQPLLALYYGWALLLSGQIKQAVNRLEAVEAALATDETKQTSKVLGHIAAMRAFLARVAGDFAATIALSRQALAHLPEQDALLRARMTMNLAIAHYLRGEFAPASQFFDETIAAGQIAQPTVGTLAAIYVKTQLLRSQGALMQALQLCQEGMELVGRNNWQDMPAAGFLYLAFSDLSRERNELSKAEEYLEKGIELGRAGGHPQILIIGYVWLALLRQIEGDVGGSQEAVGVAIQIVQRYQVGPFWPLPSVACTQARLWIAQGDLAAASRWVEASGLNPDESPITYLHEVEYLTLARLQIAQNKLEAVETLLFRLQQAAAAGGRNGSLIEILILQAITFAAQNRGEQALTALDQALNLAEGEGFVRIFVDEGAPIAELLRRAVARDMHAAYALHLLEVLGESATARQPLIEPLSERELEVLRWLAAGYSNQEIAQELVVAISTVKKHNSHIYSKLGATTRTQAVAKARDLGFL